MRLARIASALALALASALSGCGQRQAVLTPPLGPVVPAVQPLSPIRHVVLVVQENRTFNDFFATYPGGGGTTTANVAAFPRCHIYKAKTITLPKVHLATGRDLNHSYQGYVKARDRGAMDGFDKVSFGNGEPECRQPYQYTDPAEIQPYWVMAGQYALAARMFTTEGSSSFTAHQDLIAGGTMVAPNEALIDSPGCSGSKCIWGCDAPSNTRTQLITEDNRYLGGKGPFPCLSYRTLRDLLDARHVSWKYYVPLMCCNTFGKLMSAFDAIKAVRHSKEWTTNVISPQTQIFTDISNGALPAVSWVIPDEGDSDHPGNNSDSGPSWVASVVNAVGESPDWKTSVVVVLWDDWGGLYDNIDPPQKGYGGLGFRVPAIIVSPYAKKGFVSKTHYEFGSILKFIEDNWRLGSLHTTDKRSASIVNCLNYSQKPRSFRPIQAKYSSEYFLHKSPSYLPVDSDM